MPARCCRNSSETEPERHVALKIMPGLKALADTRLMRVVLDNLLAMPGSSPTAGTARRSNSVSRGSTGSGPSMCATMVRASTWIMLPALCAFQRLHDATQFREPGSGWQRSTRRRKHGGPHLGGSQADEGATFYFTL